ncbi:MAG: methylmalonyl-CoA mutase [Candidatus Azotimanducaceae bacterium]|jgi:methylmalonyl-CoA mutase
MKHLFSDFAEVSPEAWKSQIEKDLKGAPYNTLFTESPEGIQIAPFYTENGKGKNTYNNSDWMVCESVLVESPKKANAIALDILNQGITHLLFRVDIALSKKELVSLLEGISLVHIRTDFKGIGINKEFISNYQEYLDTNGIDTLEGTIHISPLKRLAQHGHWQRSLEIDFGLIDASAQLSEKGLHPLMVGGDLYHNAGANSVQQIAFTLSEISEYLFLLKAKRVSPIAISKMTLEMGVGTHYFMEIAKLRALRQLCSQLFETYQISPTGFNIYAETDFRNLTVFDAETNLLRTTTQAMSAALGGCDSLRVRPFDAAFKYPNDFSNRLARNIQLILKGESYLDKVADPSAGSYYIEELTDELAKKAWTLFQEIEAKGGHLKCLQTGFIQDLIEASHKQENDAVNAGDKTLLGTNKYPKVDEKMNKSIQKFIFSDTNPGVDVRPIRVCRLSEELEKERLSKEVEPA